MTKDTILIYLLCIQFIGFALGIVFKNKIRHEIIMCINTVSALLAFWCTGLFLHLSIPWLIASVFIAYISYLLSMLIVGTRFNKANIFLSRINKLSGKMKQRFKREIARNLYTSCTEELIYRGLFQYTIFRLTGNLLLTLFLSVIYFAGIHYVGKMALVQKIDIFIFSVIIVSIFQISGDIYCVILIHILRNAFIIMQKYSDLFLQEERIQKILQFMKGKQLK